MKAGTIGDRTLGLLALAALVAACAAATAIAAEAPRRAAGTTVTISSRVPAFSGKVKSGVNGCKSGRRVQLYRRGGSSVHLIGRDRSNSKGRWKIPVDPLRSGAYYAKAKRSKAGSVTCRGSRSDVIVID